MDYKISPNLDSIRINPRTLVLTPNQRLALRLRENYDQQQLINKKASWQSPNILALNTWLTQTYLSLSPSRMLLNDMQAQIIWERIIRQIQPDDELLNPTQTAANANTAWQTLHLWKINPHEMKDEENHEVALFLQWAHQFQMICQNKHWITQSELPSYIIDKKISLSFDKIILLSFDELTPITNTLFSQLESSLKVVMMQIEKPALTIEQTHLHDQQTEIETMAHWAKSQRDNNAKAKIGCVTPELDKLRRSLFNTFTKVLMPEQIIPGQSTKKKLFNLSAGQRLSAYPIIHTGLNVISWLTNRIDIKQIGSTLQSPYIHKDPEEQNIGASLDRQLRELNEPTLPFSALFQCTDDPHEFFYRLQHFQESMRALPEYAALSAWSHHFSHMLKTIGWPGYRTLNSEEYQLYTRWQQLLEEYKQLGNISEHQMHISEAIQLLNQICNQTIFQVEGSHAPIQILGVLEAAGNHFDHLWVMGLNDNIWPPAAKPNPFIPYSIQKEFNMPHATAERELTYTKNAMHRLLHTANHVTLSTAKFDQDRALSPSHLLHGISEAYYPILNKPVNNSAVLESLLDTQAPPYLKETIRSGAFVIKQQSQCPFKAFAKARLQAETLNTPAFGLSPQEKGSIIHDVLDRIWQRLQSQTQLNKLSETSEENLINDITQTVLSEQQQIYGSLKQALLTLEQQRLKTIIRQWLAHEKTRADFSIDKTEASQHITISKLQFTVRIDRIDLIDGKKVIIDYKTNLNSIASWFGDRPNDPQLPLYLCANTEYSGLLFAEIQAGHYAFKGLACDDDIAKKIPKVKSIKKLTKGDFNWDEQIQQWKSNITSIAAEFESGHAAVAPTDQTSCNYCDLKSLCRVEMT